MAEPATVDVLAAFEADVRDAVSFIESDISPIRAAATRFYNAEPFGDEEEGRSQYVAPVVREVVRATLPSLIKVFFGGQRVVEFIGSGEVSAEIADEMTQGVEHVFMRQNPGFEVAWAAFKDALVRKVGWIMWYWDESVLVRGRTYENATEDQLAELEMEAGPGDTVEVLSAVQVGEIPAQPPVIDPVTGAAVSAFIPAQPILAYTVRHVTRSPQRQVRVCAVPPEELFIDRDATSPYTARIIGRRRNITKGDARALGIPEELIEQAGGSIDELMLNEERLARNSSQSIGGEKQHSTDDQKELVYIEAFYKVDADGDGISELRRICTLGANFIEVHNDYADEVQLAALCPDPEPHTVWGLSQADNVADLQVIESHVRRDLLDSLKASIFPRIAYVEGQANVDDVLNTEIGAAIRMRVAGAVQPMETPFVGQAAFPVLEDLQNQREARTGLSRNAQGLDPRALQSTNSVAVASVVSASQAQVELIARIFAETGMKRLFRGIAKLLIERQPEGFEMEVEGEQKRISPSKWNENAQMAVDPSLGVGNTEQRLQVLTGIANTQATILRELGLENPLCTLQEFYHTQRQILQLSGFRDVRKYFTNPSVAMKTLEPKQPEPTPEQVIADAQMRISAAEVDVKRLDVILKDDRERDKMEIDMLLRAFEIQSSSGTKVDIAALKAVTDRQRNDVMAKKVASQPASTS